jgi:hypothetical protein
MKKKILRSIMNVTEKFLPNLDVNGNRAIDKIKARFCVDGLGQVRSDYKPDEITQDTYSKEYVCGDTFYPFLNI